MDCFGGARLKVQRAAHHLSGLQGVADEYLRSAPFDYGYRYDGSTNEHVLFLSTLREAPQAAALLTGEVVQALRTALDYTVAALIECATGQPPAESSKFEFPVFVDASEYNKQKGRKLQGVDPADVAVIDSLQPFTHDPPAKHALWMVHRLNVEDKHRRLHIVAGALWPLKIQHVGAGGPDAFNFDTKWIDEPLRFPLAPGTELFRYRSESRIGGEVNLQFQPTLVFGEPADARRWLVIPMLESLYKNVHKVVEAFASAWES